MPIYVYGCKACGEVEEHIQRFSDPPLTKCESCGGRLEKQITSAAFQLKGGGWYKDGYASSKGGATEKGASSEKGATEKAASSTSDTKTKAKPAKDSSSSGSGSSGSSSSGSSSTAAE